MREADRIFHAEAKRSLPKQPRVLGRPKPDRLLDWFLARVAAQIRTSRGIARRRSLWPLASSVTEAMHKFDPKNRPRR